MIQVSGCWAIAHTPPGSAIYGECARTVYRTLTLGTPVNSQGKLAHKD
jgi:hypothetical protein